MLPCNSVSGGWELSLPGTMRELWSASKAEKGVFRMWVRDEILAYCCNRTVWRWEKWAEVRVMSVPKSSFNCAVINLGEIEKELTRVQEEGYARAAPPLAPLGEMLAIKLYPFLPKAAWARGRLSKDEKCGSCRPKTVTFSDVQKCKIWGTLLKQG